MNLFIDIETIPAGDPIVLRELEPPGNISKQDSIEAWYKEKAPAIAAKKYRERALDSMAGEILCIGYAIEEEPVECIVGIENDILKKFSCIISKYAGEWDEPLTFIGWNVAKFDIPWIWRKAIKYELIGLRDVFNRDRYKGNYLDLMLTWATDYKDYTKMGDVAKFLGLSDKFGNLRDKFSHITGAMIYDAYIEGRMDEIVEYCKNDVEIVREIYRRIFLKEGDCIFYE